MIDPTARNLLLKSPQLLLKKLKAVLFYHFYCITKNIDNSTRCVKSFGSNKRKCSWILQQIIPKKRIEIFLKIPELCPQNKEVVKHNNEGSVYNLFETIPKNQKIKQKELKRKAETVGIGKVVEESDKHVRKPTVTLSSVTKISLLLCEPIESQMITNDIH